MVEVVGDVFVVGDESFRIQSSWSRWSWSVMRVIEYSHHGRGGRGR